MIFGRVLAKFLRLIKDVNQSGIDESKVLQGQILARLNAEKEVTSLSEVEFKVFSQWGDDGIIQYVLSRLDIPRDKQIFVEFGVENYTESNTRFLLIKDNWTGLVIDGSPNHIDYLKKDGIYWKHQLKAICAFITKDNINQLIQKGGITGEIGILSIDIDGNDYWVWDAINVVSPYLVIIEYNGIWGCDKPYTVIYRNDFERSKAHFSNLFHGTSLLSACSLAEEKGYDFIGCNGAGNNAYFVRKDKNRSFRKLTAKEGFVDAKFRESRDQNGNLTFLAGVQKMELLKGLKVFNTQTKKEETL